MRLRSVSGLSDTVLIHEARELTAHDRGNTAQLLIHLGEIDRRRLYLPVGDPSMYRFCVRELLMSEEVAFKRSRAARAARRHPSILTGILDGRLNLTTIVLLAPHLNPDNAEELLMASAHQPKSGVLLLIARHFPQPDLPTRILPTSQNHSIALDPDPVFDISEHPSVPAQVPAPSLPPTRVAPLTTERFGLQTTIDQETQADLVRARELMGPGTQVPDALKRALRLLVVDLEKKKLAAVASPRPSRPSANARHIPAEVKRIVRERDRDRCTFVGDSGHRCEERSGLEFDHVLPVARGGNSNPENLRLRCPGHNQLEADRVFGAEFMNGKRRSANG